MAGMTTMMSVRTEVDIQADTFANWCTYIIHDRQPPPYDFSISDLKFDLRDGVLLSELLRKLLGSDDAAPPFGQPATPQECVENIRHMIGLCEEQGVFGNEGYASAEAAGIRVDDIYQGRLDGTLSLLYRLISHFDILHVPLLGKKAKERQRPLPPPSDVILSWVRSFEDVEELKAVMDLTQAWRDGRALFALIARITGMDSHAPPVQHPVRAVTLAMDIAAEQLGVPDILAPADLCNHNCDNLSVMTYLAQLRNAVETREFLCNPYLYLHLLAPQKSRDHEERPISVIQNDSIFQEVLDSINKLALSPGPDSKPPAPGSSGDSPTSKASTNTEASGAVGGSKNVSQTGSVSSVQIRFPGPPLPPRHSSGEVLAPSRAPPKYPGNNSNSNSNSNSGSGGDDGNALEEKDTALAEEGHSADGAVDAGILAGNGDVQPQQQPQATPTTTTTNVDGVTRDVAGEEREVGQEGQEEVTDARADADDVPHTAAEDQHVGVGETQAQAPSPQRPSDHAATSAPSMLRSPARPGNSEFYHPTMPGQPPFVMRGGQARSQILLAPNVRTRRTSAPPPSTAAAMTMAGSSSSSSSAAAGRILQSTYATPMSMLSKPFKVSLRGWFGRAWTVPVHRLPDAISFPCNLVPEDTIPIAAGPYWLVITPPAACLFSRDTHERVAEWPLNHILRYGLDNNTLSLEIGERMNPQYAGMYTFEMSNGHHITAFDTLQRYTQLWSRRFL
ncbi:hypothetical protein PTSG_01712 [Salpingoeca rosetta]|uniref:Calponin-homology (CH) domain-containing protein n=1 Tax=Salpingoeca rosetta (strain ATCC 50818 / BSB-021) TaxID=946362 RepID=F2TYQ8_SALR5|nr:uncharacterized protein PTSG_01712 [Salpingoeca rosetta]EGD78732.1 hypothetical protein PTSG_01712 [Salpingoeca rosetta]|eukprot:XP_004997689.1 hypothetical protein PTSG_01712 [Salpingoeca rosetta]